MSETPQTDNLRAAIALAIGERQARAHEAFALYVCEYLERELTNEKLSTPPALPAEVACIVGRLDIIAKQILPIGGHISKTCSEAAALIEKLAAQVE